MSLLCCVINAASMKLQNQVPSAWIEGPLCFHVCHHDHDEQWLQQCVKAVRLFPSCFSVLFSEWEVNMLCAQELELFSQPKTSRSMLWIEIQSYQWSYFMSIKLKFEGFLQAQGLRPAKTVHALCLAFGISSLTFCIFFTIC